MNALRVIAIAAMTVLLGTSVTSAQDTDPDGATLTNYIFTKSIIPDDLPKASFSLGGWNFKDTIRKSVGLPKAVVAVSADKTQAEAAAFIALTSPVTGTCIVADVVDSPDHVKGNIENSAETAVIANHTKYGTIELPLKTDKTEHTYVIFVACLSTADMALKKEIPKDHFIVSDRYIVTLPPLEIVK